jgi:hypothetical protein
MLKDGIEKKIKIKKNKITWFNSWIRISNPNVEGWIKQWSKSTRVNSSNPWPKSSKWPFIKSKNKIKYEA